MRRQPITLGQRAKIWMAVAIYTGAVIGAYAWIFNHFFGATR